MASVSARTSSRAARPSCNRPSEVSIAFGVKAHQVGATNKAKLEYRNRTRFSQGIQQRDVIDDKGRTPLDNRRSLATTIGHNTRTIQAPVAERPVALPPANMTGAWHVDHPIQPRRGCSRLLRRDRRHSGPQQISRPDTGIDSCERTTMALSFPNKSRAFDATRRAVRFWGYDSAMEVAFFVTEDALKRVQPDMQSNEAGLLRAFDSNWDLICRRAAKIYVRGRKGSYDLVGANF